MSEPLSFDRYISGHDRTPKIIQNPDSKHFQTPNFQFQTCRREHLILCIYTSQTFARDIPDYRNVMPSQQKNLTTAKEDGSDLEERLDQ